MARRNPQSEVSSSTRVIAGARIETWAAQSWDDGECVDRLLVHDRVTVRTRNSLYEFIVLEPHSGTVLVRGGVFFPEFTRGRVAGCSLGGSFLKIRGMYVGFRLELVRGSEVIITSPVQTVVVSRGDAVPTRVM